jgi:hypothetical protein
MLLINETFFLLPNQSLSIEYQQFVCVCNMKIWLLIYFMITRLIDGALLIHIILQLYMMTIIFFHRYQRPLNDFLRNNWLDIHDLDKYSLMIMILKKEMKLIFVYVYITFLYTWFQLVNSKYSVTYFNFLRWLIEASLLPQVLLLSLPYLLDSEGFFRMYHILYVPTIIIKVPLFILMRYVEIQSDFFLNKLQIFFFSTYCDWRWKSNVYSSIH